jgi:hypothetical protein
LIESITQTFNEGQPEKEKLEALSNLSTQMIQMGINENPHTEYNMAVSYYNLHSLRFVDPL